MSEIPGRLVLLGHPVNHSLSPTIQNAALGAARIPLVYEALDVEARQLAGVLRQLRGMRGAGNVTIPHKTAVYAACDSVTDLAERVGAVNTFWTEGTALHGDNTDVAGFDSAVRALCGGQLADARLVIFGAGGAAAAVLAAAEKWEKAKVSIMSRDTERATQLAKRFPDVARVEKNPARALADATLIVNATPIGQHDDEHPCDVSLIAPDTTVMDLVYRRGGTPWVRAARERGHRASDGLTMLLEQGALAFRRWFGVEPDREAMRLSLV